VGSVMPEAPAACCVASGCGRWEFTRGSSGIGGFGCDNLERFGAIGSIS
jgi:hypothetical protein